MRTPVNMHVWYLVQATAAAPVAPFTSQPSNGHGAAVPVVAAHAQGNCEAQRLSGEHLSHSSR